MEICIVGLEKFAVALVLNEKFELGVAEGVMLAST